MGDGLGSQGLEVRIAEPGEIARIAELKSRVWEGAPQERWGERWPWQFRNHPMRPARHASNFMIAEVGGRLVGGIGWMPTQLVVDGKEHESAFTCDGFVDPELQRGGVGKAMFDAVLREYPASLWMKTSVALTRYLEKNGFTRIEPVNFLALPLDPGGALRARGWTGLGALTGWARGPIHALVRARARSFGAPGGISLSAGSSFGEEFDRLCETLDSSSRVRPRRDAAYLRWRYVDCPFGNYRVRVARSGRDLVGFVVWRAWTAPNGRLGMVNELAAHPRFPGVGEALLADALLDLLEQGVELVKALAPDTSTRLLFRRLGFIRSRRTPNLFVAPGAVERLGLPRSGAQWCLSVGDCDLDYEFDSPSAPGPR